MLIHVKIAQIVNQNLARSSDGVNSLYGLLKIKNTPI